MGNDGCIKYVYKVLLLGHPGVGKSNLLSCFFKNEFTVEHPLLGLNLPAKNFVLTISSSRAKSGTPLEKKGIGPVPSAYYKSVTVGARLYMIPEEE
ncbi:Ras-related protein RabA4d-like protein [Tanacetum coccineum]